ncbi:Uncharacterised protein [Vibrio cholerae]|nr:Uncharacterised protein [Vibrio cholerae]CSC55603.1 Uncharacterised protein [Vibrio cholerae]
MGKSGSVRRWHHGLNSREHRWFQFLSVYKLIRFTSAFLTSVADSGFVCHGMFRNHKLGAQKELNPCPCIPKSFKNASLL